MSTEDNAKLLILNKSDQVQALKELNIPADENTPLSTLADYALWAGGFLDVSFACAPTDGTGQSVADVSCFTVAEWNAMSDLERDNMTIIGLRLRAENKQFLFSLKDIANDGSGSESADIKWNTSGTDIPNLVNYGAESKGIFDDYSAEDMTDKIVAYHTTTDSAGGACRKYKAASVDPVTWSLPTVAHLMMLYKYRNEINDFITTYVQAASIIRSTNYWSACEYGGSYAWYVHMGTGYLSRLGGKLNNSYAVRGVSAI